MGDRDTTETETHSYIEGIGKRERAATVKSHYI